MIRQVLAQQLAEQGGANIMPSLAGQALSPLIAHSGIGRSLAGGSLAAYYLLHHPELLALIPFTSPRLMGAATYGVGRMAGSVGRGVASMAPNLTLAQQDMANAMILQGTRPNQNALAPQ